MLLALFEKGTGVSRQVEALLFGSQRASMEVMPDSIDFGTVAPGTSYSRTIRLSEVPSDRFILKALACGELPITHTVAVATDENGLVTYHLNLELRARNQDVIGEHREVITLITDSVVRPEVPVPVRWQVEPPVRAIPSVVSLGTVLVGESRETRVKLVPRTGHLTGLHVESCPEECSITLEKDKSPPEIVVSAKLDRVGIWQKSIEVAAQMPSGKEVIEIRCVGYARSPE